MAYSERLILVEYKNNQLGIPNYPDWPITGYLVSMNVKNGLTVIGFAIPITNSMMSHSPAAPSVYANSGL